MIYEKVVVEIIKKRSIIMDARQTDHEAVSNNLKNILQSMEEVNMKLRSIT